MIVSLTVFNATSNFPFMFFLIHFVRRNFVNQCVKGIFSSISLLFNLHAGNARLIGTNYKVNRRKLKVNMGRDCLGHKLSDILAFMTGNRK